MPTPAKARVVPAVKDAAKADKPGKALSKTSDAATKMIHARVDARIKKKATKTLQKMGLTMSDAVRVFLTRVASEEKMPFEVKVPNATTRAAMKEANQIIRARKARFATSKDLFDELEKVSSK